MMLKTQFKGSISFIDGEPEIVWEKEPPPVAGVYEIHLPQAIPRLKGESSILYIGRSGNLKTRMDQLAAWGHGATERISNVLSYADLWKNKPFSERACIIVAHAHASLSENVDPELEEVRRIAAFEDEHCELPPLNRNAPGYFLWMALQRIMVGLAEQLHTLDGFGPKRLKVKQAWDSAEEGATYVDLSVARVDRIQMVWTWPAAWRTSVRRPDWWPDDNMPYQSDTLFLFVHEKWKPFGHAEVSASKFWRPAQDEPWLGLNQPILLPWDLLNNPSDTLTTLLSKGVLGKGGKAVKPDAKMSGALRTVWENLAECLDEVVKKERAAARVAKAHLASQEGS